MNLLFFVSVAVCLNISLGQSQTSYVRTTRWVGGAADAPTGEKDFSKMWNYLVKQMNEFAQSHPFSMMGNNGMNLSKEKQAMPPVPSYEGQGQFGNVPPVDQNPPMEPKPAPPMKKPVTPPYVPETPMVQEPVPESAPESPPKVAGKQPSSGKQPSVLPDKRGSQRYCTEEYRKLPGHTLCMHDKPTVMKSGMTRAEQIAVLRHHNELRDTVKPAATDLVKLKWDDRLAAVAQKWANQCEAGHDKVRDIPSIGMSIGQNVAGGYRSWRKAVQMWYDEIEMWIYGRDPDSYLGPGGWRKIGHFTQMVQNGTYLVGCGYAECRRSMYTRYYVCDYAAGQSNLATPYTSGQRCSACPNSCVRGQCDCRGRVCMNGGTLDPNTCKCKCTKTYTGPTCEDLNCPAEDAWVCERDWPPSHCDRFINVPEECPYMCGICKRKGSGGRPGSGSGGAGSPPNVFVSEAGCKYVGKRSSPEECRGYGDGGKDIKQCNKSIGCADCKKYYNVKKDMCPVMCGLCDPPCSGKKCLNDGTLNVDTCTCKCKKPFYGDNCENGLHDVSAYPVCQPPECYCTPCSHFSEVHIYSAVEHERTLTLYAVTLVQWEFVRDRHEFHG